MTFSPQQKRSLTVVAVLATIVLAVIAVVTAIRLQQVGTEPVAPSAPKSKPRADEVVPTPDSNGYCYKSWSISASSAGCYQGCNTTADCQQQNPDWVCGTYPCPPRQGCLDILVCYNPTCQYEQTCSCTRTTPNPISTSTPGPSVTPAPTSGLLSTPTPGPSFTPGPTNTPTPGSSAAFNTPIPTVSQQNLPQAGSLGQTITFLLTGLGILGFGLLLL